jgi:hypothetical protein
MTTTFTDVVEYVSAQITDGEIEQLYTVLKTRSQYVRKVKSALNATTLKAGDKVRLSNNMSPQYLRNKVAIVNYTSGTKAYVHFTEYVGRFAPDVEFSVPASAVTKID